MLSFFLSSLLLYKYTVLVAVIISASFWVPIPATALLVAAGAFAAQGYLDMGLVILCGFTGSVLGDAAGYGISSRYGYGILRKIWFSRILASARFATVESIFSAHAISTIFSSRFLATGIGPLVNILAGLSGMSFRRFFLTIVLGEGLYVVIFSGLGYAFSDQWESIWSISQDVTTLVVLAIILMTVVAIILIRKQRRK